MCTKMSENELRNAVSEFRKKAHEFYAIAKEKVEFPFEELFFIETVSAAYELLNSGKKIDGLRVKLLATKRIMEANPMFSVFKVLKKCEDVIVANRKGSYFSWRNYCEQYLRRTDPENAADRITTLLFKVFSFTPIIGFIMVIYPQK